MTNFDPFPNRLIRVSVCMCACMQYVLVILHAHVFCFSIQNVSPGDGARSFMSFNKSYTDTGLWLV